MDQTGNPGSDQRDLYANLGLTKDATTNELKKAYHKLSLKHHPDKGGDEEKFKIISAAWGVLEDEQSRLKYNSDRKLYLQARGAPRVQRAKTPNAQTAAAAAQAAARAEAEKVRAAAAARAAAEAERVRVAAEAQRAAEAAEAKRVAEAAKAKRVAEAKRAQGAAAPAVRVDPKFGYGFVPVQPAAARAAQAGPAAYKFGYGEPWYPEIQKAAEAKRAKDAEVKAKTARFVEEITRRAEEARVANAKRIANTNAIRGKILLHRNSALKMDTEAVELKRWLEKDGGIKDLINDISNYFLYTHELTKVPQFYHFSSIDKMNLDELQRELTNVDTHAAKAQAAFQALKQLYSQQQENLARLFRKQAMDESDRESALRNAANFQEVLNAFKRIMENNPELVGGITGAVGGIVQEFVVVPYGDAWFIPRLLVILFIAAGVYKLTGGKRTIRYYKGTRVGTEANYYSKGHAYEFNSYGISGNAYFFTVFAYFILKLLFGPKSGGTSPRSKSGTRRNKSPKSATRRNTLALRNMSKSQSIAVSNEIVLLYDDYLKDKPDNKKLFVKIIRALVINNNPMPIHDLLKQGKMAELDQYLKPSYEPITTEGKLMDILCELGINIVAEYFFAIENTKEKYTFLNEVFFSMSGDLGNAEKLAEKIMTTPLGNNPYTYTPALKNRNSHRLLENISPHQTI